MLVLLRLLLLVLVYLVFLRVLRAVWVELRSSPRERVAEPVGAAAAPAAPPPAAGRAATLRAIAPPSVAGTAFSLDAETTIGRAAGCRISVDDSHVSKLHARVYRADGDWFVEDLGSTNGTHLNESLVDTARLRSGDRIRVGETVLEFA